MKKKILFTIWTFSGGGGAERILANISNALPRDKYEIDILEYTNLGVREEEISDDINLLEPILKNRNRKYMNGISNMKRLTTNIKALIYETLIWIVPGLVVRKKVKKEYDIEVAFTYLISSFIISGKGKKFCWIHTSIEDLDYKQLRGIKKIKTGIRYLIQRKHLKKMNNIIAISNKTEESIKSLYPEFSDKVVKIYNGYNFNKIDELSKVDINYRKEKPLIIAVGRLQEQKNFALLIEAAKVMNDREKDFELLILGDGEERTKLSNRINEYNLEGKVKLLGYIGNPYPYMKLADVYCMTSIAEGFPTVIVEALYLGCPFISTDVAGIDELSSNGKCGIKANYDANEIATKIITMLKDKKGNKEIYNDCREKAREYSMQNQLINIEKLFNQ